MKAGVKRACTTCRLLKNCKFVTERMIETGDYCGDWVVVEGTALGARRAIIADLGPGALRYEVHHLNQQHTKPTKARRRKKHV